MIWHFFGWLARLSSQDDPTIAELIVPPTPKFTGFDPSLRERTATRRKAAEEIRNRANAVDTGARTADVLRRVK